MIHLTMNDSDLTVVSVPVKSISRWMRNKNVPPVTILDGKTPPHANSVVFLKGGDVLYVIEYPNQIDALYLAATRGEPEPLRKSENSDTAGFATDRRWMTWSEIIDAIREGQTFDKDGKYLYTDETLIRIRLGFT